RPKKCVAWDAVAGRPLVYDPATQRYEGEGAEPALTGSHTIRTGSSDVECKSAFELCAELCRRYPPDAVESICGVPADQVVRAAELLWTARPVSFYGWSGIEQQSNATQIFRAISLLYALPGSFDVPGGNVLFPAVPTAAMVGDDVRSAGPPAPALGLRDRPLGPSSGEHVSSDELYRAVLEGDPYTVRGLVGFGANLLLSHADTLRGREALAALDFYVHLDLFMNPTAELAGVVRPVASAFEREALTAGVGVSEEAQSLVQLRRAVVAPPGEARSDTDVVFDLACRLGLGDRFWNGGVDAAYRQHIGPAGVAAV